MTSESSTVRFRNVYSVSDLTKNIKKILEEKYPIIWINGEISNLRIPSSGHAYFTLKDEKAQISAVLFQSQRRKLGFRLEDGMSINGLGRVSVYEVRGTYQIILEHAEPHGIGAMQIAIEQLKDKLSREGLFDAAAKKSLPSIPEKISLITSPTGSVVHDILQVVDRRYPNVWIEIVPVSVQGDSAAEEIAEAFAIVNGRADSDLIILARGGGSLEDLMPFHTEMVARSIFHSTVPVISAIGHETDFTIADYVADMRAPTPSAAAEMAVPEKHMLYQAYRSWREKLVSTFFIYLESKRKETQFLREKLISPRKQVAEKRFAIDDLRDRLVQSMMSVCRRYKENCQWQRESLLFHNPLKRNEYSRDRLADMGEVLQSRLYGILERNTLKLRVLQGKLDTLNPLDILTRGYGVVRTIPDGSVVRDSRKVSIGDRVEVILGNGTLFCRVEQKKD